MKDIKTVKDFINILKNYPSETLISFHNELRGDDLYMKSIAMSYDGDEITIYFIG
jgi:hypothetical protein